MSTPQRRMVSATRQIGLFHQPGPKVAGIVLAAGRSTRMGQPKQLLPFRGRTVIEQVVDNALASTLQQVIVVLGHEAERVQPLMAQRKVSTVVNAAYGTGQSSSLKAGLGNWPRISMPYFFSSAINPWSPPTPSTSSLLPLANPPPPSSSPPLTASGATRSSSAGETFPRMESLSGDCGARALFQEYVGKIHSVEVHTPAILFDLDTEEDYRRLLKGL